MAKEITLKQGDYDDEYWKYQGPMRYKAQQFFGKLCILTFTKNEYAALETLPGESVVLKNVEEMKAMKESFEYFFSAAMLNQIEQLIRDGNIIELSTAVSKCIEAYDRWLAIPGGNPGGH